MTKRRKGNGNAVVEDGKVGRSSELRRETCLYVAGRSCSKSRRTRQAGVRAPIVVMKSGNADGAKGCRKVDEMRCFTNPTTQVLIRAKLVVQNRARSTRLKFWKPPSFMLTILQYGMKGTGPLPNLGASTTYCLTIGLSVLSEVKPLTGEPYAGDPHVRFGGGSVSHKLTFLPLSIFRSQLHRFSKPQVIRVNGNSKSRA